MLAVILVVVLGQLSATYANGGKESAAKARNRLSVDRLCQVGQEMQFVLPAGRAARLDCQHLKIGLTEVLFWTAKQRIHMYCNWADGNSSRNDKPISRKQITWIPKPPRIGFLLNWKVQGQALELKIRAETDENTIQEMLQEAMAKFRKRQELPMDPHEKLVGFIRLWSEVKYNFAFFDQVPELDWDAVLEEYLPKVQEAQSPKQYYRVLKQCVALLQDGHTSVSGPNGEPTYRPPIEIRSLQGKAVIVGITPSSKIGNPKQKQALLKADLKLGEEITHVDGRPIKKTLEKNIYPYIFASTEQWRDQSAYPKLLKGENGTEVKLRIKRLDGATRNVTLIRGSYARTLRSQGFSFRQLADHITYVNLDNFGSEEIVKQFDNVFEKIKVAKGLIIDVRENGGGNSAFGDAIISYLTNKPLEGSRWKTRQYIPAFRAIHPIIWGFPEPSPLARIPCSGS